MFPDIHGVDGILFFRRHQTFYVCYLKRNNTNKLTYKAESDSKRTKLQLLMGRDS